MRTEREGRTLAVVLGILVLVVVLLPAVGMGLMGPRMMGPGMMWGYGPSGELPATGGWGWGLAMALGGLAMLAFWGALIISFVSLILNALAGTGGSRIEVHRGKRRSGRGDGDGPVIDV